MEPLSALALACNVLDLVERGIQCGRLVSTLYRDGTTRDQDGVEDMVDTMNSVIVGLQTAQKHDNTCESALGHQIEELLVRSTALCTELRDRIRKCQPETKGSWRAAGLAALRKVLHKSGTEALEKELESCRSGLVTLFSAVTQYVPANSSWLLSGSPGRLAYLPTWCIAKTSPV